MCHTFVPHCGTYFLCHTLYSICATLWLMYHMFQTICSMFYPQTFNLFELLWWSEGFNPKPIELNLVLFILAKISCKTNVPTFVPTLMPTLGTYFCAYFYIAQPQTFNLFELLWQSEGFNPNPIELNTMYYVKQMCLILCLLLCLL